jgi:hypothetical protein
MTKKVEYVTLVPSANTEDEHPFAISSQALDTAKAWAADKKGIVVKLTTFPRAGTHAKIMKIGRKWLAGTALALVVAAGLTQPALAVECVTADAFATYLRDPPNPLPSAHVHSRIGNEKSKEVLKVLNYPGVTSALLSDIVVFEADERPDTYLLAIGGTDGCLLNLQGQDATNLPGAGSNPPAGNEVSKVQWMMLLSRHGAGMGTAI